jgi:micrococcal nuclease
MFSIAVGQTWCGSSLPPTENPRASVFFTESSAIAAPKPFCYPSLMRRLAAAVALLLLLPLSVLPACSSVSVGADNKYGQTRGVGMVGVPIETVTDQVKAATTRRFTDLEGPLSARVLSVDDGNTITVLIDNRQEKVRLIGIDAPELDQVPWGVQARDALRGLVDSKTVRLETDITIRDQYRRLLAYVYVREMLVNLEMVRKGEAVIYTVPPNVAHVEDYQKAQHEARGAGRGVWNPQQPLDINPDCYRKLKKRRE